MDHKQYKKDWYQKHKTERLKAEKTRKSNKHAKGECRSCNQLVFLESKLYCEKHWYKYVKDNNKLTTISAEELKALAVGQNFICPYTGLKLVPGFNMSLDHRIPKSKGGSDTIENLQWVETSTNLMKINLLESEFILKCKLIASRF